MCPLDVTVYQYVESIIRSVRYLKCNPPICENTMSKMQTNINQTSDKPRRLGRGLSALLGEPVAVAVAVPSSQPVASTSGGDSGRVRASASAVASVEPSRRVEAAPSASGSEGVRGADEDQGRRVVHVPCEAIVPSPFQPRRIFDEQPLKELAASIQSAGVVQPILVRPRKDEGDGKTYELIAGERRWRASMLAGVAFVPAVVASLGDEQAAEWALIENVQRADLSPMERAWAVRGLSERFGLSHAQVGEKLGIDRSSVSNLIRLTELEPEIVALLEAQKLSGGHGKALLSSAPGELRVKLANLAANQGWSVRRLEEAVARAGQAPAGPAPEVLMSEAALGRAAAMRDLEKQLGEHLGTSVRIRAGAGGKRGTIVMRFYGLDHFDGLMSKMGFTLK